MTNYLYILGYSNFLIMGIDTEAVKNIEKFVDPSEVYYHQQKLKRIHRSLRIYQDSWLENTNSPNNSAIAWADRSPFPLTWTGYLNTSVLDFREVGFSDHFAFYTLSREVRNNFLRQQKENLERNFPELVQDFLEKVQIPSESRHQGGSPTRFVHRAHQFYRELQKAADTTYFSTD